MTPEVRITPIHPDVLDEVWADIEPLLALATDPSGGRYTTEDLRKQALSGILVMWEIRVDEMLCAACTTRIAKYPNTRELVVDWLGGREMGVWLAQLLGVLERHARTNKCPRIKADGRAGWGRLLKKHGWAHAHTTYQVELDHG